MYSYIHIYPYTYTYHIIIYSCISTSTMQKSNCINQTQIQDQWLRNKITLLCFMGFWPRDCLAFLCSLKQPLSQTWGNFAPGTTLCDVGGFRRDRLCNERVWWSQGLFQVAHLRDLCFEHFLHLRHSPTKQFTWYKGCEGKQTKRCKGAKWNIRRQSVQISSASQKTKSSLALQRLSFCSETPYEANLRPGDCKNTNWSLRMLQALHSFRWVWACIARLPLCSATPPPNEQCQTHVLNSETWIVKYVPLVRLVPLCM